MRHVNSPFDNVSKKSRTAHAELVIRALRIRAHYTHGQAVKSRACSLWGITSSYSRYDDGRPDHGGPRCCSLTRPHAKAEARITMRHAFGACGSEFSTEEKCFVDQWAELKIVWRDAYQGGQNRPGHSPHASHAFLDLGPKFPVNIEIA